MSKTLNRPMFRMGGKPDTNTGIVSGFETPRQNYKVGDAVKKFTDTSKEIYADNTFDQSKPEMGFGFEDYMSLVKLGAGIASAPGQGSGFKGLVSSSAPFVGEFADDLSTSMGNKRTRMSKYEDSLGKFEQEQRATELGIAAGVLEVEGSQELQDSKVLKIDKQMDYYNEAQEKYTSILTDIQNLDPNAADYDKQYKALNDELQKSILVMYGSLELALPKDVVLGDITYATLMSSAEAEALGATGYTEVPDPVSSPEMYKAYSKEYIKILKRKVQEQKEIMGSAPFGVEKKADGGRIGYANGSGPYEPGSGPDPDPNAPPIMQAQQNSGSSPLAFEELRARLPKEVSDDVIKLIATSEQALIDFAQIQTQEDIARFNQRYNADLQLPAQVA